MNQKKWTSIARGLPWDVMALVESPAPTLPPPVPLPKDVPVPEEWILVKVAYAALNPGAIFQSTLLPMWARQAEAVPEMDLSGTVVDVWHPDSCSGSNGKEGKTRFKKGDKIAAMLPASHTVATGTGALAQYVRIPARYAVLKPPNATLADAAGVMLAGLTARQLVVDSGAKTGDRVLINAASGGIGHLVVQMVRNVVGSTGYVVGICGGAKASMVKSLGAEEIIDYTVHKDLPGYLVETYGSTPFDTIIDVLGHQSLYLASPWYLVAGGIYESVGIKPPTFFVPDFLRAVWQMKKNEYWPISRYLWGVGRKWGACSMMNPTLEDREVVMGMLEREVIKVVTDSVWKFEEAEKAYRHLGDGHAGGKVLVKVDESVGDENY